MNAKCISAAFLSIPLFFLSAFAQDNQNLRIWDIRHDSFDLIFQSVITSTNKTTAVLKHRSGKSYFVEKGSTVMEYKVESLTSGEESVFEPSVNANLTKKTGTLVLTDAYNNKITLILDKLLLNDEYRVRIIDITSGRIADVRRKDKIDLVSDADAVVQSISKKKVEVKIGEKILFIDPIKDEEKRSVLSMWEKNRQELIAKEKEKKIQEQAEAIENQEKLEKMIEAMRQKEQERAEKEQAQPSSFMFATEYLYPTEYRVLQTAPVTNGSARLPLVVIPTKFERRISGFDTIDQYYAPNCRPYYIEFTKRK